MADNGGPLFIKAGVVLVVISDYGQCRGRVSISGCWMGVRVFKDGVVMPYSSFNFEDFTERITPGEKGACENRRGKLKIFKGGGDAFKSNKLGFYNTVECMLGVERCMV